MQSSRQPPARRLELPFDTSGKSTAFFHRRAIEGIDARSKGETLRRLT
jgi:hypothetical protein